MRNRSLKVLGPIVFFFLIVSPPPSLAALITLNAVNIASGVDNGPKDGTFDAFINEGTPSLVDNGFTEFRLATEFDLSSISDPIISVILSFVAVSTNTSAAIEIHGYEGDGIVSLIDIGFTGNSLGSVSGAVGENNLDVTNFVKTNLTGNIVGFSLDEATRTPSPLTNRFEAFQLNVVTSDASGVPEPSVLILMAAGLAGFGFTHHLKKQQA